MLISDFLIDISEIREALYTLGDHEIKIIQVLDPVEKDFSLNGNYHLFDSENGDKIKVFVTPRLRTQYQQKFDEHQKELHKICNDAGVDFYSATTNKEIFDVFYKILE